MKPTAPIQLIRIRLALSALALSATALIAACEAAPDAYGRTNNPVIHETPSGERYYIGKYGQPETISNFTIQR